MESRKMVLMNLFAGLNGDTDVEKGCVDIVGEGDGRMNWGSCTEVYTC